MTVALCDLDGVSDIVNVHAIVGDVVDASVAAAALKITRKRGRCVRPDLDAGAVAGVVHADVGHVDVLHDIVLANVLAKGTNANSVGAIAPEGFDQDVGGVGLERHTIYGFDVSRLPPTFDPIRGERCSGEFSSLLATKSSTSV